MTEPDGGRTPSKSARKRAFKDLQDLAVQMTSLADVELERLGVAPALREALKTLRGMRPSGERNRQIKYCVRFMDGAALDDVRAFLHDRASHKLAVNRRLHAVERWRDRLLQDGDRALAELLTRWPDLDRQHTRQLVRDAARERATGKPPGAARKLFRHLRESGVGEDSAGMVGNREKLPVDCD